MPPIIQRAFGAGELSPALHARADLAKYVTGLRTCRNWQVLRTGGIANRAGLRFINATKSDDPGQRLMRYIAAEPDESVLIEIGPTYFRFYQDGALVELEEPDAWDSGTDYVIGDIVEDGGVYYYAIKAGTNHNPPNATYWYAMPDDILEIPHPFGSGFYWDQSGNVITLTSHTDPPHELIYEALTRWVIREVETEPTIATVTAGLTLTPGAAGTIAHGYVVTAVKEDSFEESYAGTVAASDTDTPTPAVPNVITWDPVDDAVEYNVYKSLGGHGIYGYIGTTTTTTFEDGGFTPDFLVTPPRDPMMFVGPMDYPAVSGTYQQRRLFANTVRDPEAIFGSRIGYPSLFTHSLPLQEDDAISFRVAGKQYHAVRHLLGLKSLIVATVGGSWRVAGPGVPLTPFSIPADQETYTGFHEIPPVVVGNSIIYIQDRGEKVLDLQFDQQVEGLNGTDLTTFASHLFDTFKVEAIAYQENPHSTIWCVRDDGTLLGLTYIREQEMWGWHRHDTGAGGRFEDVCVVPENGRDAVYVIVRRTIGDEFVRYIERLEPREFKPTEFDASAFFVDSGLTYSGAPTTSISGLGHLEGEVVAVVGDGAVIFNGDPDAENADDFTVTAGAVALGGSYSVVHVGLPIRYADAELLDLDVQGTDVRDRKKRVASVTLLLERSSRTFRVGPDADHLTAYKRKPHEAGADEFTGQVEIATTSAFGNYGRVFIRQVDPLPITILGVIPNVEVGG